MEVHNYSILPWQRYSLMLDKYVDIISETDQREQYQKCVPAQQLQLVVRAILGGFDLAKTLVEIGTDAQTIMFAVMMPRLKTDSQGMHITIFLFVSEAGLK